MSRNVVAHGTPDRSFAGLMDHLTGFDREDAPDSDPDFGAIFRRSARQDSASTDESLTNPRTGPRTLLPVTERRPAPGAATRDASALSYEKALSLHARRRAPSASAPIAPPTREPRAAFRARETPAGAVKTAATARNTTGQIQERLEPKPELRGGSAKLETALSSKGRKLPPNESRVEAPIAASPARGAIVPRTVLPAVATPEPATGSELPRLAVQPSQENSGRRSKPTATAAQAAGCPERAETDLGSGSKSKSAPQVVRSKPKQSAACAASPQKQSRSNSRKKPPLSAASAKSRTKSTSTPAHHHAGAETSLEEIELLSPGTEVVYAPSPVGRFVSMHPLGELDQRRTIVSVRLTEAEFACLRERAEESGISVSAYMRSCVVDADQLRTQVKRALQEMRSLSASPGTAQMTTLTASGGPNDDSWNTQGWFRLVLRPFAFLFGPLFPSRRSA